MVHFSVSERLSMIGACHKFTLICVQCILHLKEKMLKVGKVKTHANLGTYMSVLFSLCLSGTYSSF